MLDRRRTIEKTVAVAALILIIVGAVGGIVSIEEKRRRAEQEEFSKFHTQAKAEILYTYASEHLAVENVTSEYAGGMCVISFDLTNTGDLKVDSVDYRVLFYSASGDEIGQSKLQTASHPMQPGHVVAVRRHPLGEALATPWERVARVEVHLIAAHGVASSWRSLNRALELQNEARD